MQKAPIPADEQERLESLHKLALLDTEPEERFDRFTKEAVAYFSVPISTISLIDTNREWFKSCQGLLQKEGPREYSFCGHALLSEEAFIIEDTLKDPRFADNPSVVGPPFIRFYAGVALRDLESGKRIGVFCIKDNRPRKLTVEQVTKLLTMAEEVEKEINKTPVTAGGA